MKAVSEMEEVDSEHQRKPVEEEEEEEEEAGAAATATADEEEKGRILKDFRLFR